MKFIYQSWPFSVLCSKNAVSYLYSWRSQTNPPWTVSCWIRTSKLVTIFTSSTRNFYQVVFSVKEQFCSIHCPWSLNLRKLWCNLWTRKSFQYLNSPNLILDQNELLRSRDVARDISEVGLGEMVAMDGWPLPFGKNAAFCQLICYVASLHRGPWASESCPLCTTMRSRWSRPNHPEHEGGPCILQQISGAASLNLSRSICLSSF